MATIQQPVQYVDQYGNPVAPPTQAIQYIDQYGNPVTPQTPPTVQYVDQNGNPVSGPLTPTTQQFIPATGNTAIPNNFPSTTKVAPKHKDNDNAPDCSRDPVSFFCGETPCEKILCSLSILLFILGLIEMPALLTYATAFGNSESDGCCGIISEPSSTIDGAICHENDIIDGNIDKVTINGSILCLLDNITCLDYTFRPSYLDKAINASQATPYYELEDCLIGGGYELSDLCGSETIQESIEFEGAGEAVQWCYIAFFITLITSICNICECIGCFKKISCCEKKSTQGCLKLFEVLVWALILYTITTEVENPAANGYESDGFYVPHEIEEVYQNTTYNAIEMQMNNETYSDLVSVEWYSKSVCGIDGLAQILWIDYDIEVPGWVQSDWYGVLAIMGIVLSVLEMALFFAWNCCNCCQKKENYPKTKQAIELAQS